MENKANSGANPRTMPAAAPQDVRKNPVCLEVVVGIRNLPNGPGLTEARTVIVFETGAVLRLAAAPPDGHSMVVVNPQGREANCRVVANQNRPSPKGYVEVEFVEPAPDFWGTQANIEPKSSKSSGELKAISSTSSSSSSASSFAPSPVRKLHSAEIDKHIDGHGPTFEDVPDIDDDSEILLPVHVPSKTAAPKSAAETRVAKLQHSKTTTSGPVAQSKEAVKELTSAPVPEAKRETGEAASKPLITPTDISQDRAVLGVYASVPAVAADRPDNRKPLVIGAAAIVLIAAAAGFFYLRKSAPSDSLSASAVPAQVAGASMPPANISNGPIQPDQGPAPAIQASSPGLTDAALASATPSSPADVVRTATQTTATFERGPATIPDDAPRPARRPVPVNRPDLKINAPVARNSDARTSSELPTLSAAEITSGNPAAASMSGAMLVPSTAPNLPAPPRPSTPSPLSKTLVREPKLISSTAPVYPPVAKQSNVQGDVVVSASVDANGKVGELAILSGPDALRRAAVDAVRQWKYQPATSNGTPVPSQVTVKVEFRLR